MRKLKRNENSFRLVYIFNSVKKEISFRVIIYIRIYIRIHKYTYLMIPINQFIGNHKEVFLFIEVLEICRF
jgi:hypothetical protein